MKTEKSLLKKVIMKMRTICIIGYLKIKKT